jgi:hypothetical protein
MKAHEGAVSSVFKLGPIEFISRPDRDTDGTIRENPRLHCSYCGSITVEDVIKAFQTKGVEWSGSDWKYGWPHKFYIRFPIEPQRRCTSHGPKEDDYGYSMVKWEDCKFYADHLLDATPEQIAEWNSIVKPITRIGFEMEDGRLKYSAPYHGWQGDGTIGEEK